MTHPPAPLRPVSEDHRHADYAPRSAVLSILRDAGVDETIVAQVSDVLPAPVELEPNELALRNALLDCKSGLEYIRHRYGDLEGVGFDRAINAATTALTQAPRSCWQPAENAPTGAVDMLLLFPNGRQDIGWRHSADYFLDSNAEPFKQEPTHWQPLPEPPATAIRSNSHD